MKKVIILILAFSASISSRAQAVDSTAMLQTVTVTKFVHLHAIRCVGTSSMSDTSSINYLNDLIAQGFKTKSDSALITVSVPAGFIVAVFNAASKKPNGVVSDDNKRAEAELYKQVKDNPWIVAQITKTKTEDAMTNHQEKEQVKKYLAGIKNPCD